MTELAPLDNYQGSDPLSVVWPVPDTLLGPNGQATIFTLSGNSVWRVRVLVLAGVVFNGAGTVRLGIGINFPSIPSGVWSNGGADSDMVATVPQNVTPTSNFAYTWSTETSSAYYSQDNSQGWVAQAGLPLVFLPAGTQISFRLTDIAGGTNGARILDGFVQVEQFPLSAVQAGGDTGDQRVYLLQAARPGDAGGFA